MNEPVEKENIKTRIRSALDVLENYVSKDGKIDATKLTQELTKLRTQLEEAKDIVKSLEFQLRVAAEHVEEELDAHDVIALKDLCKRDRQWLEVNGD